MIADDYRKRDLALSEYFEVLKAECLRNLRKSTRFRPSFVMQIIAIVVDVLIFIFLGLSFQKGGSASSEFATYVILGLAFSQPMANIINASYSSMALHYWSGQLEAVILSPVPIYVILLSDLLWTVLQSLSVVIVYLLVGMAFGVRVALSVRTLLAAAGLFALGVLSVAGLGLVSASMFVLIDAKGFSEPFGWLCTTVQRLVCGVYFPLSVLPRSLLVVARLFPQTYVIQASRILLGSGGSELLPPDLWKNITLVTILGLAYLILGIVMFGRAVVKAQAEGDLSRWR